MQVVYLSGNLLENKNAKDEFYCAELFLKQMGYTVMNPAEILKDLQELKQEERMKVRYRLVDIADIIFMVSGWQKSKDANAELSYAKSLGKEAKYQDYYAPWRKGQLTIIPNVGDESIIDDAPFRKVGESEEVGNCD
jgi:hypothetical protein